METSDDPGQPRTLDRLQSWLATLDHVDRPLIPAATVIVVRDAPAGVETLMMRRSAAVSFAEGMWVFPGGRIDRDDHPADRLDDDVAARQAAVREAKEEADLDLDIDSLVHYSHWVPPLQAPKRFSTSFFLAPAPEGAVTIDDGEIIEHRWCRPVDALGLAAEGRISVLPPTWVTLFHLSHVESVAAAIADTRANGPQIYATRIVRSPDGLVSVWHPDAAYDTGVLDAPGRRHRLVMSEGPWSLEIS